VGSHHAAESRRSPDRSCQPSCLLPALQRHPVYVGQSTLVRMVRASRSAAEGMGPGEAIVERRATRERACGSTGRSRTSFHPGSDRPMPLPEADGRPLRGIKTCRGRGPPDIPEGRQQADARLGSRGCSRDGNLVVDGGYGTCRPLLGRRCPRLGASLREYRGVFAPGAWRRLPGGARTIARTGAVPSPGTNRLVGIASHPRPERPKDNESYVTPTAPLAVHRIGEPPAPRIVLTKEERDRIEDRRRKRGFADGGILPHSSRCHERPTGRGTPEDGPRGVLCALVGVPGWV
jgi:hypothetical protein